MLIKAAPSKKLPRFYMISLSASAAMLLACSTNSSFPIVSLPDYL